MSVTAADVLDGADLAAGAMRRAAGGLIARVRAGVATLPPELADHFGVTDRGEPWVSPSAYRWVSEAGRAGLVPKVIEVTTKTGKTYKKTVMVRPADAAKAAKAAKEPAKPDPAPAKSTPPKKPAAKTAAKTAAAKAKEKEKAAKEKAKAKEKLAKEKLAKVKAKEKLAKEKVKAAKAKEKAKAAKTAAAAKAKAAKAKAKPPAKKPTAKKSAGVKVGGVDMPTRFDPADQHGRVTSADVLATTTGRGGPAEHAAARGWAAKVEDPDGEVARQVGRSYEVPVRDGDTPASVIDRGLRRQAFHADSPGDGESPKAFAERHYPELKAVPNVNVEGIASPAARASVHDLYEMRDLAESVGNRGASFYISDKPVTQTDDMGHLAGVAPRGWPSGKTWDVVGGCYDTADRKVIAGSGESGAASLAGHETGHAIGDLHGLNDHPETIEFHTKLHAALPNYLQQDGPGGAAGRQAMIAETIAVHTRKGKSAVADMVGREYADWLDDKLKTAAKNKSG